MSSIKNLKKDKKFSHSGNNIIINIEFQNGIKKQIEINSGNIYFFNFVNIILIINH